MANEPSAMKTAYHIVTGPHQMYEIDANGAVGHHPAEWSFEPWSLDETNAYLQAQYEREAAEAKAAGRPEPEPPQPLALTDAQLAELDEDGRARAEAAELVAEADAEERDRRAREAKVAAARAFLATPVHAPVPQFAGIAPMDPKARSAVAIDDDWESFSVPKLRALAMKLGAPNTVTADEAKARIGNEMKRRKEGAPKPATTMPLDQHPAPQPIPQNPQPVPQAQPPVIPPTPVPAEPKS